MFRAYLAGVETTGSEAAASEATTADMARSDRSRPGLLVLPQDLGSGGGLADPVGQLGGHLGEARGPVGEDLLGLARVGRELVPVDLQGPTGGGVQPEHAPLRVDSQP